MINQHRLSKGVPAVSRTKETQSADTRPALLGGPPVRPQGPPLWPPADPDIVDVLHNLAATGDWGRYEGPHCDALVAALCKSFGCNEALLCASGTAAVELALRGLRVQSGDEVILAGYDFRANMQNVLTLGAVPVLVDLDPENWNLDPAAVGRAITSKTRALIVSHLHGGAVPMHELMQIAQQAGVAVLEDACQNPGAILDGIPAGRAGDVGVVSFGGSKTLSAGRGGAVFSNRLEVLQRIRIYVQRGNVAYPLSEMQAAVLLPQIEKLAERNDLRARRAAQLIASLGPEAGLAPLVNRIETNPTGYYKLGLKYNPEACDGLPRDIFAAAMRAEGIALDPGFAALHHTYTARRYRTPAPLEITDQAHQNMLVLHHPVLLESPAALTEIETAIQKIQTYKTELKSQAQNQPGPSPGKID